MLGDKGQSNSLSQNDTIAADGESLSWRVRPSDWAPQKRWSVLIAAVLVFLVGTTLMQNLVLGVIGTAVVLASTAEFWLGTNFRLDAKGAKSRCGISLTEMEWTAVKRAAKDADGVKLSPVAGTGRLSAFRGVFLKYGDQPPGRIEDFVRRYLPNDVRLLEG